MNHNTGKHHNNNKRNNNVNMNINIDINININPAELQGFVAKPCPSAGASATFDIGSNKSTSAPAHGWLSKL